MFGRAKNFLVHLQHANAANTACCRQYQTALENKADPLEKISALRAPLAGAATRVTPVYSLRAGLHEEEANAQVAKGHRGCIVFTSSAAAAIASPFTALYAATKSFLSAFGASLAVEVRHRGIDVLVFHPSPVATR